MKAVFEYNGIPKLRFMPEGDVEKLILQEMAEASQKGAQTKLTAPAADGKEFVLEVGRG